MSARLARQLHTYGAGYETKVCMNTILQTEQPMNTTILNYPDFQTLPKGIKQMLLVSETHFFDQRASHRKEQEGAAQAMITNRGCKVFLTGLLITIGGAFR
jgi:hypothetical protein